MISDKCRSPWDRKTQTPGMDQGEPSVFLMRTHYAKESTTEEADAGKQRIRVCVGTLGNRGSYRET